MSALLTPAEHALVEKLGSVWGDLCAVMDDGPTRAQDCRELIIHVHALQHAVMAQAAARAYPTEYRRLGSSLRVIPPAEPSREQRVEAAEDRAEQAAFDAWRERGQ